MSKSHIIIILVILVIVLGVLWFMCRNELSTCEAALRDCEAAREVCETELEECRSGSGDAAFQLVLELDSFGAFMPINNQVAMEAGKRKPPEDFCGGFFAQLGNFKDAVHSYQKVVFEYADSTLDSRNRLDVDWLDIICSDEPTPPITLEEAKTLLPKDDTDTDRLLHYMLDISKPIALTTIWKGDESVQVSTTRGNGDGAHGHDRFVFSSPSACHVRIWKELSGDPEVILADSANPVVEIHVIETTVSADHGGPHYPPWDFRR